MKSKALTWATDKVTGELSDASYAAGWALVKTMPEAAARRLFETLADRAAARNGGPKQLRRNLARVVGVEPDQVPDELMRASMRSYARYWKEAFRLPNQNFHEIYLHTRATMEGLAQLTEAHSRGKGIILALPHSGNWDRAGVWAVQQYGGITTVAERLKPESLFWRFVRYRESLGFEIFPLTGGEKPPYEQLANRLREGKVVCLLGERDLTRKGVPVTFFGAEARMPAGPVRLAMDTGAALIPTHCWFTESGWGLRVGAPIDVSGGLDAGTQALADVFAHNIAEHPADWHMLQPLWLDDLSDERRARVSGDERPTR